MSYSMIITLVCFLAIVVSGVLIWYCRKLVSFISSYNQIISALLGSLVEFEEHLESVYSRETFYGDTTLQNLLTHARGINEEIKSFINENEDIFIIEEKNEKEIQD